MEFNRQFFVADLLSSDTLISEQQNYLKLYIADLIQKTEISTVYVTLLGSGRNTAVVHLQQTEMLGGNNFFHLTFTPIVAGPEKLKLLLEVVDMDANVYPLTMNVDIITRGA